MRKHDFAMALKAIILGHSFVSRFKAFIREHQNEFSFNLNLSPQQFMVQYAGRPGGTVQSIKEEKLETVGDFPPQIVVLDLRTNDLSNPVNTPESVTHSLYSLRKHIIFSFRVKRVIVMHILHRCRPTWLIRYRVDVDWFNERVDEANRLLSVLLKGCPGLVYWKQKGLWQHDALQQAILPDGVHLSCTGIKNYFKNIRAAVISAKKEIQSQ